MYDFIVKVGFFFLQCGPVTPSQHVLCSCWKMKILGNKHCNDGQKQLFCVCVADEEISKYLKRNNKKQER